MTYVRFIPFGIESRFMNISRSTRFPEVRWYLGVRCKKCRTPILFALDYSGQHGGPATPLPGKLVLTCSVEQCRHRADYSGVPIGKFQKSAMAAKGAGQK